uniref:Transposase n=1 Tax=Streptomyces muensis TaxID=1077944 RepID=A0A0E3Z8G6_STRM4|nr:transposase [Streptomyces muensis]
MKGAGPPTPAGRAGCSAEAEVRTRGALDWYWAVDVLTEAGAGVHLTHPLGVKAFAYRRVKNDERDAADLTDLLRLGRLPVAGSMLAVYVRQCLKNGDTVEVSASCWWKFSADTITQHGEYLLAFVDGHVCVGAFEIVGAEPDETEGEKYVFDLLRPAARFQWALGRKLPLPPGRNPCAF